jgi:hypothetical protein
LLAALAGPNGDGGANPSGAVRLVWTMPTPMRA